MKLEDVMMKVIDGKPIVSSEKEYLRQSFSLLDETSQLLKTWQLPQSKNFNTNYITSAFEVITSVVVESPVDIVNVNIPSEYKHLIVFSSGRSEYTGGGGTLDTDVLGMQFNGDEGNNYQYSAIYSFPDASPTVDTDYQTINFNYASTFASDNALANNSNGGLCFIPHSRGNFYKQTIVLTGGLDYQDTGNPNSTIQNGWWLNTAPIEKISFFLPLSLSNIKEGSVISVYGLR